MSYSRGYATCIRAANFKIFLDNARYQRCVLVENEAKELGIDFELLTSYSPILNLMERARKFVENDCFAGQYYDTFEKFQDAIDKWAERTFKKTQKSDRLLEHKECPTF